MRRTVSVTSCFLALALLIQAAFADGPASDKHPSRQGEWQAYGHDPGGTRFSPLDQINRSNVSKLKVAWTYRTGDFNDGTKTRAQTTWQHTPLLVDGTMYLATPFNRVIALDPETGAEKWTYDPKIDLTISYDNQLNCRGLATWADPKPVAGAPSRRLFMGTNDARLICLDAATGKPCAGFGKDGQVDLSIGVGITRRGWYQVTSPPAVVNGVVVVGSAIGDNQTVNAPSGVVRAYDARTGELKWAWDPGPQDDAAQRARVVKGGAKEKPSATTEYRRGSANVWSIMTTDDRRDLVFVPTGNTSPDYYGGVRNGSDYYSSSVVALRGSSGQVVWHFQTVHHDIWDYDVPAAPALITVKRGGREIPAVAVATKVGHLFILNRDTGKPIFPVEERAVPQNAVEGETPSPTQPFPVLPKPLRPERLNPEDAFGINDADREDCRKQIAALRNDGVFTPPSLKGTLVYPGDVGGMNWSGMSFDPVHGLLITSTNRLARAVTLIPRAGIDDKKLREMRAESQGRYELAPQTGTPYLMKREFMLSPNKVPCNPPPWSTLVAIDLSNGSVKWERPLGSIGPLSLIVPDSAKWGSPSLGGSIVTAGGLVFVAASMDDYLRAFDVETGAELWKAKLPAGGQATPMTYMVKEGGKQFLVICAGGHMRLGTKAGDYVVAFALPSGE
ncbi:MAG TPA: pyrroloquinoline quinone-dependent dehydrogenase [Blastocatellia bacterium]|nr:pyrroloquinoline quinone-dependent dehydrogenase [Blastocatellia bacterium]